VSVPDGSVWLLARTEGAILLTGESKLRKAAQASDVEARGVLWVLDELIACLAVAARESGGSAWIDRR
jgi:hypothetical protein